MEKKAFLICVLTGIGALAGAQEQKQDTIPDVGVREFRMEHSGNYLSLDMELDLSDLDVNSNRAVLLTPRLVNGNDSIELSSVGIYGRKRYYYYLRNGINVLTDNEASSYRSKERPESVTYSKVMPYSDWMDGATLKLYRCDYGCCQDILAEYEGLLGRHDEAFFPELVFVQPDGNITKTDTLSGSAFIDFIVDSVTIDPSYRENVRELGKIQASIDSLYTDRDVTITGVWLKGFASPESPYSHNTDLAIGRTAAVKEHIMKLYDFPEGVIETDYEPEDWEGLRRFVENTYMNHRTGILALIDSDMDPDAKEAKIKRTYPKEYQFLLYSCYPALRHTDYRIVYNIRTYNDVEEIKRVMLTHPQRLSQNEFYLAASSYEPGTDEFTSIFETAVRMFPDDEIANLNAAGAAIRRDDYAAAQRHLQKAGDSAEADYARGALAFRMEDYDKAREYMTMAGSKGLQQAGEVLDQLDKGRRKTSSGLRTTKRK